MLLLVRSKITVMTITDYMLMCYVTLTRKGGSAYLRVRIIEVRIIEEALYCVSSIRTCAFYNVDRNSIVLVYSSTGNEFKSLC